MLCRDYTVAKPECWQSILALLVRHVKRVTKSTDTCDFLSSFVPLGNIWHEFSSLI